MKLSSKKLSKEELDTLKDQWPDVSHYISKSDIKRIAVYFRVTEIFARFTVLNSLEILGWNSKEQNARWKEERIDLWFSVLRNCLDENDPFKRWEKAKLLIIDSFVEWFDDTTFGALEIIRDPEQPFEYRPWGPPEFKMQIPYVLPSITEQCLRTIILFNTTNIDTPSDILYWPLPEPNFCEWRFRRKGWLIRGEFKNGDTREKFIKDEDYVDTYAFLQSYSSTLLEIEINRGNLVEVNLGALLSEVGISPAKVSGKIQELKNLVIANVREEKIKEWLFELTGIRAQNKKQIEDILQRGYYTKCNNEYAKKYFPEYENQLKNITASSRPYWTPDNGLLDIWKLKIDLGEMYLSKVSKKDRIRIFEQLVTAVGFDPFAYKTFHGVLKEWRREGQYEKIQNILKVLKKQYSSASLKKKRTKRDYALICLALIKEMLNTGANQLQASKAVLEKVKIMNLSLRIDFSNPKNNPSEQIRTRALGVIKEQSKLRKFNLKSQNDLKELRERIMRRYDIDESEYM